MTSHFKIYFTTLLLVAFSASVVRSQSITLVCDEPSGCAPHGIIIHAIDNTGSEIDNIQWNITTPQGGSLQSSANPYVAIFNQPGNYDIQVVADGESVLIEDYITIYSKPTAVISASDTQGCFPFCTDFIDNSTPGSGAIVSRSWDFGDGNTSADAAPEHCYEQVGNYTPVLAVEDENGCFASTSAFQLIQVTSNFPQASFLIGSQSSCFVPTSIEFTAVNSPDIAQYDWILDNQLVGDNNTIQSIEFAEIGNYDVCLRVENAIGCVDTLCHDLFISDSPQAHFSINSDSLCVGQTAQFNNLSIPSPTLTEWDFSSNGTIDNSETSTSLICNTPGTFAITMIAHYGNACSVTIQDTLFVSPNPYFDFTGSDLFSCSPPLTTVFTNSESFNPAFQYIWSVNGVTVSNAHNLEYTFNEYGIYNVRLRRFNEFGCERSRNKISYVTIESPDISFEYEEIYCIGENAEISNITVEDNATIIDYSWDFNGDGIEDAVGPNPSYTFNVPGEFFATLTAIMSDGCVSVDTTDTPIIVLESSIPTFSSNLVESCAGETFVFCTDFNEDNTYTWDFHDGSSPQVMLAVDSCVTHLYEDTGFFDVTLTVFNGACNTFLSIEDYIHIVPPLALFEFDVVCENFSVSFENLSIGGDSLVWDFGDGSPLVINESNPVHAYGQPGQYSVTLSAFKSGSLCYDTKVLEVAVASPSAELIVTPAMGCAPLTVSLDNTSSNDFWDVHIGDLHHITVQRNDNPFAAAWSITHEHDGDEDEYSSNDPTSFEWPSLVFTSGGSYDLTVAVIDEFGCEAETTYTEAITVWPGGDFSSLSASVVNGCDNGGVTVEVHGTHPMAASWVWAFSDGAQSNEQHSQHTFTPPFNYNEGVSVTLTALDADGCSSNQTFHFDAVLPAIPSFTWLAPPVCREENIVFTNTSAAPEGTIFQWSFGDGSSLVADGTINHAYSDNGFYNVCLAATNSIGCTTQYCLDSPIEVYSPHATANYSTELNTCLFAVSIENTTQGEEVFTWWDFGDYQTGLGDTVIHTYPIGVFDVTLIVGAFNGCTDTLIIEDILNYSSSIGPFTQVLDTTNCAPFGISLHAFNPQDNLFDYFWDFNDGNGDPFGGTSTSHAYTAPGAYCPSIMMTDPNGCDVYISCTDTIFVENYSSVALVPAHICAESNAVIAIENAESISWDHPWVTYGSSQNTLLIQADSSFDFLLTSQLSDCIHSQTVHVDVLPLPAVYLALVDSLCANTGEIPLMGGVPEGGNYLNVLSDITQSVNTNQYSEEFVHVRYEFMGDNGCSNSANDSIYILPPPVVAPLLNQDFCAGDNPVHFPLDAHSNYTVDNVTTDFFEPIFRSNPYHVAHHVTDSFGCHNSATALYQVHALPQGLIHASDVCAFYPINISVQAVVEGSQIIGSAWSIDSTLTGYGTNTYELSYANGGEHRIEFVLESEAGCVAEVDTSFMVYDQPNALFSSSVACEKDTTELFDLSTFGNDSIVSWMWSYSSIDTPSAGDTSVIFDNPGSTMVQLTVTTEHGCNHQTEREVIVRHAPIIEASATDVCLGAHSVFEGIASIPSGGVVNTGWTIEGIPYEMLGTTAQYQFIAAGIYTYTFRAGSNFGCVTEQTDSAFVYSLPTVDIPPGAYEFCEDQEIQLGVTASVDNPSVINSLTWLLDGAPISGSNPAQFNLTDIGAYVLDVVAVSNHGCETRASLEQPIVVYPNPFAGFTWSINQGNELPAVTVTPNTSSDITEVSYNWGDGSSDELEFHEYDAAGSYEITQVVTNSFGCSASHTELIEAYNGMQFYIPNAFTPDQNNYNETFYPVVSGSNITHYVFRIFNRWGEEIFTSSTPGEGWDGNYKGAPVQDGAYSWSVDMIVRGRPELFSKKGSVLLMR